jgi:hypothetical protein
MQDRTGGTTQRQRRRNKKCAPYSLSRDFPANLKVGRRMINAALRRSWGNPRTDPRPSSTGPGTGGGLLRMEEDRGTAISHLSTPGRVRVAGVRGPRQPNGTIKVLDISVLTFRAPALRLPASSASAQQKLRTDVRLLFHPTITSLRWLLFREHRLYALGKLSPEREFVGRAQFLDFHIFSDRP